MNIFCISSAQETCNAITEEYGKIILGSSFGRLWKAGKFIEIDLCR